MVREMFLQGVSTRKVEAVLKPLLDTLLSARSVFRIVRSLDVEVRRCHSRPLAGNYCCLLLLLGSP